MDSTLLMPSNKENCTVQFPFLYCTIQKKCYLSLCSNATAVVGSTITLPVPLDHKVLRSNGGFLLGDPPATSSIS